MEENNINKSNKIKMFILTMLILLVSVAGISYAYFTIQITGNDTASSMRLRTANMSLVYNDVQIVSGEYVTPGWSDTKTLTVTNNGNVTANYSIVWRDLINEITNNELVIYATCSSSSGTCDNITETAVPTKTTEAHSVKVKENISIAPGVTHTYTLTALFKETGSNQNYNQNKYFNGTLNIEEYKLQLTRSGTDSVTGLPVVTYGTEEFFDITNAVDYSTLISTNGNIYNYAAGKSILLARYNLYVGLICIGYECTPISTSASGYGLQSADASGDQVSPYDSSWSTTPRVATVPFSGTDYWNDQTNYTMYSKYGSGNYFNNIYDTDYVTAPNYSNCSNSSCTTNANYSIAYYVEEYVDRLGIDGTGRLLTAWEAQDSYQLEEYIENQSIEYLSLDSRFDNGQSYWIGSTTGQYYTGGVCGITCAEEFCNFYFDDYNGNALPYQSPGYSGVRPVIVVNTSDIQSS